VQFDWSAAFASSWYQKLARNRAAFYSLQVSATSFWYKYKFLLPHLAALLYFSLSEDFLLDGKMHLSGRRISSSLKNKIYHFYSILLH